MFIYFHRIFIGFSQDFHPESSIFDWDFQDFPLGSGLKMDQSWTKMDETRMKHGSNMKNEDLTIRNGRFMGCIGKNQ